MEPFLIGVKYCGGCKEQYSRAEALRETMLACTPCTRFEPTSEQENKTFDSILVLCGCHVRCPDTTLLKSRYGQLYLSKPDDTQAVISKIFELQTLAHYDKETPFPQTDSFRSQNIPFDIPKDRFIPSFREKGR